MSRILILVWILFSGVAMPAHAQSEKTLAAASKPDTALGPTVIRRRLTLIDEYTRLPDNDYRNRLLIQPTFSFGAKRDYGLTVEIPLSHYEPGGNPTGDPAVTGLGDVRGFFIHPFRVADKFIHSYGLEAYFDTASERQLGAGATTLLPSYALTYRANKSVQLILLTQYEFDVDRAAGVSNVRRVALRPFAILNFPDYWYSFIEGKAVWDLERDSDLALTLTVSLGKFLGAKRKFSVFAVAGGPLNDYAHDNVQRYQLKLGANYFF